MSDRHLNLIGRLFESVTLPDQCFEWTGGKTANGYGRIKLNGKLKSPHRIVFEIFNGPLTDSEMVLHRCDNPPCINPRHLFKGSGSDNMRDCAAKGRINTQRDPSTVQGENRSTAKLNNEKVRAIRAAVAAGEPKKTVARRYEIHASIVQKIIKGERWSHVQ